jgi:CRP-like cAMP-binding protein
MSHAAQGSCDCPLASKFCDLSALRRQAWFHAIRSQDMEAMDKFVKSMGGSIPREYFIVLDDKEGYSALHMAARQNLGKSMAHLLEMLNERTFKQGILDMQQESTKTTPLIEACKSGHLSMVKLLCEVGAKWYLPCGMGMQPRKYAEINDRLDIVAYFNENSASSNLEAGLNMDQSTLIAEEVDNLADSAEAPAVDTGAIAENGAEGEDGAEVGEASAVQATHILLPTPKAIDAELANVVASQQHKGSISSITSSESEPQTPLPCLSPHEAEEVMRVLCNCSFFPSMDAPSLKELSRLCCHIQLLPGETLAKNPDEADAMYIIVKGKIIVEIEQLERLHVRPERQWSIRHRLQKRRYKRRLTEYDCFGENIILIGEKMYIKIEAEEQTEMLALSVRSFNRFLMHRPSLKPDLASFLAGQTKNADAADDYDESELALEMEQRIHEFHKLPDEDEEFEEQKPSRVRAIVEIPLAEPAAKNGLNLAHRVSSAQGQEWLKYSRNAPILHGDLLPRASKDNDTGCLSYLR